MSRLLYWLLGINRSAGETAPGTNTRLELTTLPAGGAALALIASVASPSQESAAQPLIRRASALREKSWGAAFLRQRNPDAAGRSRPRAPSAAPAAAVSR